jgi:putative effector of murein hydrolase LrgA (UPF0299 family)
VLFIPQLRDHALSIGVALIVSVALAIGVTAGVVHWLERGRRD